MQGLSLGTKISDEEKGTYTFDFNQKPFLLTSTKHFGRVGTLIIWGSQSPGFPDDTPSARYLPAGQPSRGRPREHTRIMRTPTMQFESFSRRAIAAALLSVPLATTPAVAFDNALPGREARAAAKKTPGPSPGRQKGHAGSQRLQ